MNTSTFAALFNKSDANSGRKQRSDLSIRQLTRRTSNHLEIMDQWLEEFLQTFQI